MQEKIMEPQEDNVELIATKAAPGWRGDKLAFKKVERLGRNKRGFVPDQRFVPTFSHIFTKNGWHLWKNVKSQRTTWDV